MGFFDDLAHAAKQLGNGLAQIPGDIGEASVAPFGFVLDVAMAPFTGDEQDSFVDEVKSSAAYRGKQVAGAVLDQPENLKDVAMGTLHVDQALWHGGVTRGLSTGLSTLTENPFASSGYVFNPQNWRENWNASEYVDIGDALYNSTVGAAGRIATSAGAPVGAVAAAGDVYGTSLLEAMTFGLYSGDESKARSLNTLLDPDFDIHDREAARTALDTGIGKAGSAMAEFGVRWYADPLYVAGKGAMVLRREHAVKPITTAEDMEKALASTVRDRKGLGKFASSKTGDGSEPLRYRDLPRGIVQPKTRGTGLDDFSAKLNGLKTPEERHDWLMRNKVVQATLRQGGAAGPALVHMLAKAETPEARAAIIRLGADPTARNARILARADAEAEAAFYGLKDGRIHGLERMLADPRLSAHMKEGMGRQLAAAKHEATLLERRYGDAWRSANLAGGLRSAPRITAGQKLSDAVGFPVFQASRYNLPGRVYKAALTKRGQSIDLNRPGAAAVQMRLAMDRVGHGLKGGYGFTAAQKGEVQLRITAATSASEVVAGVRYGEDLIAAHMATRTGVNPTNFAQLIAVTRDKRDAALARHSGDSSFSGGTTASGQRLDEVRLGEDGVLERIALSHTDMANRLPMIEVDRLADIARRFKGTFDDMSPAEFRAYLEGWQPSRAQRFRKYPDALLDNLNQVWKPAQLMRLGWPIRVLVDEQMRIMAHVGVISMIPLWSESVRKSLVQTRGADKAAKMMDLIPTPGKALRLREEMIAERARRIAAHPEPTPPQADWLPNTVVRGDDGKVLTVYHGTNKPFGEFSDDAISAGSMAGWYGKGHYFSTSPEFASRYAARGEAPNVRMAHLDMAKVWDWEKNALTRQEAADLITRLGRDPDELLHLRGPASLGGVRTPVPERSLTLESLDNKLRVGAGRNNGVKQEDWNNAVLDLLRGKGYQGTRHNELTAEGSRVVETQAYVVFSARSIKSPHGKAQAETTYDEAMEKWLAATWGMSPREIAEYMELTSYTAKLAAKRADPAQGKFAGTRTARDATGREQSYDDFFAGEMGDVLKRMVSSAPDYRIMMTGASSDTLPDVLLGGLRQGAGNPITIKPLADSVLKSEIDAHAVAYTRGWEKAVNEQIGMDPIFRKILSGETDERIVTWLRYSKEGRALRKENPIRANKQGLDVWIATLRQHVDTYLPSEPLRMLALENRARVSHLDEHYGGDLAARPHIHGESIDNDRGTGVIWEAWNKIVEKQYRYLGAMPTNVLSRHPYAAYVYRQEMDRQIAQWAPDVRTPGGSSGRISHDEMERMRHRAREQTIGEVRHTLYELANASNLAHTMRYLMPFYQAWQEVLTTWGRLALADPSRISRLNSLWEAPSRLDATYTDPSTGKEYVALPNILKPIFGGPDQMGMPKDWVRQLMFNNEFWFTPGLGPPIQVPLSEIVRHRPNLEDNTRFLLPYGVGDSMIKDFLPTVAKRYTAGQEGEDSRSYVSLLGRISQDLIVSRNLGENDYSDVEMQRIAVEKTKALFNVTSTLAMILPFSPKFASPHQLYIDIARQMREEYEGKDGVGGYVNGLDVDGKTWREAYVDRVGEDYWVFTQSLSKSNTGLPPTELGYEAMEKYGDLVAEAPKLGSLVAGPDVYGGEYSSAVARYQATQRVSPGSSLRQREQLSPEQLIDAEQRDRGWAEFRSMNLLVTASLLARGIKSLSDPRAAALANLKRMTVDSLEQRYSAWGRDYRQFELGGPKETIDFLNKNAADPRLENRAGWTQVRGYLAMRQMMSARLKMRDAQGGSANLEAKSNADLKRIWDASVTGLKAVSIDFDEIHSRWLSHDRLMDGG